MPSGWCLLPKTECMRQVQQVSQGKESKLPQIQLLVPTAGPGSPPGRPGQLQLCRGNYRIKWNNTGWGGKRFISQV